MKFIRQDAHKKIKLKNVWRKPKGLQNKMRLQKKGYHISPKIGMGTPNSEKNFFNGKELIRITNIDQLSDCKNKIIILSSIGMKKKIAILEEGIKQNLEFVFDAKKVLADFNKSFTERKKVSDELKNKKKKKAEKNNEKAKIAKMKKESDKELDGKKELSEVEKKKELDKELIHRK